MAEYVFIDDMSHRGKLAISYRVFDKLVSEALLHVKGISKSAQLLGKNQKFRLNRPVLTTIKRGIVHVKIAVDIAKGTDIQRTIGLIQDEVNSILLVAVETIPFDVRVKVEQII